MYSTQVNYYIPRQLVVVNSGSSFGSYQNVYSKNLKIHKGVDNKLQFQFINQEQKPVDITGKTITCKILSYDGTTVLLQKSLDLVYAATGIAELIVNSKESLLIDSTLCFYTLTLPAGAFDFPVFVDDSSGGRGVIDVVDSVNPKFIASVSLAKNAPVNIANVLNYTSSTYVSDGYSKTTVQAVIENYTGNIKVSGSVSGEESEWYTINETTKTYTNSTATEFFVITGIHPFLRLDFASTTGNVQKILVR